MYYSLKLWKRKYGGIFVRTCCACKISAKNGIKRTSFDFQSKDLDKKNTVKASSTSSSNSIAMIASESSDVACTKDLVEALSVVGGFYKDKKDFLIRDDSNGKKKEGAIQAAVEYLNRFGNKVENNLWIGSFKENSFILEKKYYEETIIKKLSLDFLDTKHVEELSQLGEMLKIFRKNCYIINSANEKINVYSPIDFLKRIVEEGKKSISIQRFKGLGEMNPEELWETTLNPENNTLLKVDYSGNDVDNETTNPGDRDREIFKILMGEDVVPRKDFINKNAINVNNLDI